MTKRDYEIELQVALAMAGSEDPEIKEAALLEAELIRLRIEDMETDQKRQAA